ncbi:MAG: serine hydrolase domain-containing protein [Propionibacteriaceae bacterium]|nr:serine hydrolase domain-containing protein [Propionibacteriaceae bacterium]
MRHLPWIALALLTIVALALGTPRPAALSDDISGDPALAQRLRDLAPTRGHQSVAATVITRDTITHAAIGEAAPGAGQPIQPGDPVELGSITKTFNGFLLADAVARGEVTLDDPVGEHLRALEGTPLGSVTLEELATHTGGVPPLPPSILLRGLSTTLSGGNPYATATKEGVLTEAGQLDPMGTRGSEAYSNLGATLLGWALADAAGAPDWATHVDEQLLGPLGVDATFSANDDEIPSGTVPGFTTNGFAATHWTSPAFRPAGSSTYTSPAAVAEYAQAILTDRVPGADAMEPRVDGTGGTKVGLGWFISQRDGEPVITWHNGGTDGYRTLLAIDREAGQAVFVVGNTDREVDSIGLALITDQVEVDRPGPGWQMFILPVVALALIAFAVFSSLRAKSRAEVIGGAGGAVFGLMLARALGPWALLGGWVWAALALATAVAIGLGIRRWPRVPWHPKRWRVLHWLNTGLGVVLALAALLLLRR